MNNIVIGSTYNLKVFITDLNGSPKIGLSVGYKIKKASDNSLATSGTLVDQGNGIYDNSYNFNVLGQYYIIYTTPTGYTDEIAHIFVQSEMAKENTLLRTLGLMESNYRLFNTVYDSNGDLISATRRLYNNVDDVNNDQNHFAEFSIIIEYTNRLVTLYKAIKVL